MFRESQALTKGIFALERNEGLFIHTVKRRGPYDRSHGLATSRDFKQWKDYGLIFHADELDQKLGHMRIKAYLADPTRLLPVPEHPARYTVDVYNFAVFRYEGFTSGCRPCTTASPIDLRLGWTTPSSTCCSSPAAAT